MIEYYGANIKSIEKINKLLGLDASGDEQDWEFEFANPKKITVMMNELINNGDLDVDDKSALALLIIASWGERDYENSISYNEVADFVLFLESNNEIRQKMFFYWIRLARMDSSNLKKIIFGVEC